MPQDLNNAYITWVSSIPSTPFRLLDLPQELQDHIYEYHLQHCDKFRIVSKDRIASDSNLHLVCRKVDIAVAAVLARTALVNGNTMLFKLRDFNFDYAIDVLQRLLDCMKESAIIEKSDKPNVLFELSISDAWLNFPYIYSLPAWCEWLNTNSKHGIGIDIMYQMASMKETERAEQFVSSNRRSCSEHWFVWRMYGPVTRVRWDPDHLSPYEQALLEYDKELLRDMKETEKMLGIQYFADIAGILARA